ncbi:hypothetical protein [Anabaena sp. WA102]|uniref:hypothetical protein n=1 Tax=Anabaena sp. WA102 TaxID=1647413 RepID=UPI0009D77394|nr:hypothetical protein [Anabaena sp. WA102]
MNKQPLELNLEVLFISSLVIGHWLLVIGHWSLVIGYWSLVIGENDSSFFFLLSSFLLTPDS